MKLFQDLLVGCIYIALVWILTPFSGLTAIGLGIGGLFVFWLLEAAFGEGKK